MTDRLLRTFVAVELPDTVRRTIADAQTTLRERLGPADRHVRWVDPASAHLTLKFLGPTRESSLADLETALHAALAGQAPIELRTGNLGCFPDGRRPNVLWLGLDGELDPLAALRDAVEAAIAPLGWPTESRPFQPHLTLARLRKEATPAERAGVGKILGAIWPPAPAPFQVAGVSLMLSDLGPDGPRYTRLAHAALD